MVGTESHQSTAPVNNLLTAEDQYRTTVNLVTMTHQDLTGLKHSDLILPGINKQTLEVRPSATLVDRDLLVVNHLVTVVGQLQAMVVNRHSESDDIHSVTVTDQSPLVDNRFLIMGSEQITAVKYCVIMEDLLMVAIRTLLPVAVTDLYSVEVTIAETTKLWRRKRRTEGMVFTTRSGRADTRTTVSTTAETMAAETTETTTTSIYQLVVNGTTDSVT